jgi:hypothetical protein
LNACAVTYAQPLSRGDMAEMLKGTGGAPRDTAAADSPGSKHAPAHRSGVPIARRAAASRGWLCDGNCWGALTFKIRMPSFAA